TPARAALDQGPAHRSARPRRRDRGPPARRLPLRHDRPAPDRGAARGVMLVPLRDIAPMLGCRDRRTVRRRLSALGVGVVRFANRDLADPAEVTSALRAAARIPERPPGAATRWGGRHMAAGERLTDAPVNVVRARR